MSKFILKAEKRNTLGTSASKAMRNTNKVPAVVYGKDMETVHIGLDAKEIANYLAKNHVGSTLDIEVDSKKYFVVLKNVQYHPVSRRVNHVDFQRLQANVAVRVTIPVFIHGKEDLKDVYCQELLNEVEIESLGVDLVDSIEITLDNPAVGDQATVGDLEIFKSGKVTPVTDPEALVYIISEMKENVIEEEGEESVEPALVGEEEEASAE